MLGLEQRRDWLGLRVLGGLEVRRSHFDRTLSPVFVELDGTPVPCNVDKDSFWKPECGELINIHLRRWIMRGGLKPRDRV